MESLKTKLEAVEDEHFTSMEQSRLESFDQEFRDEAMQFRGAFQAVSSITRSLLSKKIEGLAKIEETKYFRVWGYPRFADYLDSDEVGEISKNKYYELKGLLMSEGPEAFDVFSGKRIPVTTRKLLAAKGVHIAVEGEELVIENHRVPISDTAAVKELVETVHEVLKVRDEREEKKDKKIEKLTAENEQGRVELETKQRELDALNGEDPMAAAVAYTFSAFNNLIDGLKESDDEGKKKFAEAYMPAFGNIWFRLSDAAGVPSHLYSKEGQELQQKVAAMKPVEEMTDEEKRATRPERAIAAMVADGSFDDLD
jgi:hypothetical protein